MDKTKQWDKMITSQHKLLNLNLKQVLEYRDLIVLLVRRDIVTTYKQTILGPLWYLIQPIFSTVMYIIIFGGLAKLGTDGVPQILFYFSGTMLWGYFSSTLSKCANIFSVNKGIFGKVYFPRLTAVISTFVGEIIKLLLQLILFILVYAYYLLSDIKGITFQATIIWMPLIIVWLGIMAVGVGLIISSITTKYHDLAMALSYFLSLFMYATPVVYPLSEVSNKYVKWFYLNPISAPIECFRRVTFGSGYVPNWVLAYSIVFSMVVLLGGLILFNKNEKTFVDVI